MIDPAPDHQLLTRRACGGDDEALASLVALYHDRVYRYGRGVCRETDLDDAVQEAFVALTRSRHTFRGDASIATWLYTTVRNACRQLLRPLARRQRSWGAQADVDELDDLAVVEPGPEELAERQELIGIVHDALARLDPEHGQILVLRDLEGLTGEATATQLGLSLPAMKSRLHRARAAMPLEIGRARPG